MRQFRLTLLFTVIAAHAFAAPVTTRPVPPKRFESLQLNQVGLADALADWQDRTGLNVTIDWPTLESAGVGKDAAVTLHLRQVPARTALTKILEAAAPRQLTFYVEDNVVQVTTLAAAKERTVTRVFRVSDLIVDVPDFQGPSIGLGASRSRSNSGGGGGGGGGGSVFGSGTTANAPQGRTSPEKIDALVKTIQATIRPDIWDVNGGKSTIKAINGTLVVTAPLSVQKLIGP